MQPTKNDLKQIAMFFKVIKNYQKIIRLENEIL